MKKKIAFCIDLNETSINQVKRKLTEMNLSEVQEVHLVHGFQRQVYVDNFFFTQFPFDNQIEEVEKSVLQVLSDIEMNSPLLKSDCKVVKKCIIADLPKNDIAEYIKESAIDLAIIATRGKHGVEGLFSSSFAEYMIRHVEAELLIIRC